MRNNHRLRLNLVYDNDDGIHDRNNSGTSSPRGSRNLRAFYCRRAREERPSAAANRRTLIILTIYFRNRCRSCSCMFHASPLGDHESTRSLARWTGIHVGIHKRHLKYSVYIVTRIINRTARSELSRHMQTVLLSPPMTGE